MNINKRRHGEQLNIDDMSDDRFVNNCREGIDAGVQVIGGCCGFSASHIEKNGEFVERNPSGALNFVVTIDPVPERFVEHTQRRCFLAHPIHHQRAAVAKRTAIIH